MARNIAARCPDCGSYCTFETYTRQKVLYGVESPQVILHFWCDDDECGWEGELKRSVYDVMRTLMNQSQLRAFNAVAVLELRDVSPQEM